jgi:hypothetical protein
MLIFPDGSAELEHAQIIKLAGWIDQANSMFAKYKSASVEAGATVKAPGRTSEEATQLARLRADKVALALKTLFPVPLSVDQYAHAYRERQASDIQDNDFAAIQLYPDLKTSKLPECTPDLPDGLAR